MSNRSLLVLGAMAAVGLGGACAPRPPERVAHEQPTLFRFTTNAINVTVRATAAVVQLEQDLFLTLEASAPAAWDLCIPEAHQFTAGFDIAGAFDEPPALYNGRRIVRRRLHLRPRIAAAYQLGPLTIPVVDHSQVPAVTSQVTVARVSLPVELPTRHPPPDIQVQFDPLPPAKARAPRTILLTALGLLLLLILPAAFIRRGACRARVHFVDVHDVAIQELERLMARDLPRRGKIEDFYHALTDIVRRHIERTHAITAPEQTTEELLRHAAGDPRLSASFVELLGRFLREADVVKFAARQPPAEAIQAEIARARRIIQDEAKRVEKSCSA